MKIYERIRKILNSCDNNQMRDVDIQEIESDDVDADVRQFCTGTNISCEKLDNGRGATIFEINADGLKQQVTYTELVIEDTNTV